MLPCSSEGFSTFDGNGVRYRDSTKFYSTVEPAIDFTSSSLLMFAWRAAGAPSDAMLRVHRREQVCPFRSRSRRMRILTMSRPLLSALVVGGLPTIQEFARRYISWRWSAGVGHRLCEPKQKGGAGRGFPLCSFVQSVVENRPRQNRSGIMEMASLSASPSTSDP